MVLWFGLLPAAAAFLVDRILRKPVFLPGLLVLCAVALWWHRRDVPALADDLFDASVRFLEGFQVVGWDYETASVIVCLVFPALLLLGLAALSLTRRSKR